MWNLLQADQTARLPMHVALKGPNAGLVGHKKRRPDTSWLPRPAAMTPAAPSHRSASFLWNEKETTRHGLEFI
jgi:hypothetical protein